MRPIRHIEADLSELEQYITANAMALDGLTEQLATDLAPWGWTLMRQGLRRRWAAQFGRRRLDLLLELTTTRDAEDALFYRDHAAHDTRRAAR